MKAYVLVTGAAFALVLVAHILRLSSEGMHLIKQPVFLFTSILSIALTAWAWRLFRALSTASRPTA